MEKGFNDHRLTDDFYNRKEVLAVETFNKPEFIDNIDIIIFSKMSNKTWDAKDILNERERKIVLSTIQWLGTRVGQEFIKQAQL